VRIILVDDSLITRHDDDDDDDEDEDVEDGIAEGTGETAVNSRRDRLRPPSLCCALFKETHATRRRDYEVIPFYGRGTEARALNRLPSSF
jgi:hypothetical protein